MFHNAVKHAVCVVGSGGSALVAFAVVPLPDVVFGNFVYRSVVEIMQHFADELIVFFSSAILPVHYANGIPEFLKNTEQCDVLGVVARYEPGEDPLSVAVFKCLLLSIGLTCGVNASKFHRSSFSVFSPAQHVGAVLHVDAADRKLDFSCV